MLGMSARISSYTAPMPCAPSPVPEVQLAEVHVRAVPKAPAAKE